MVEITRKKLQLVLVLLLGTLIFASGCASSKGITNDTAGPMESTKTVGSVVKKDVTLSMMIDVNNSEQNLKILNEAAELATKNSENFNIKIRMDTVPLDFMNKKVDVLAAGVELPDMISAAPTPVWMKRGLLADLTEWYDTSPLKDDYMYPALLDQGKSNGKLYSIPIKADSIFLIYNKDLLKKAGIENTDFTSVTWEEFQAMLEEIKQAKLKAKNGKVVKGVTFRISAYESTPFVFSSGGDFFNEDGSKAMFDTPEAAQGMANLKSLVTNGYADKPETDYANWMSTFFNENAVFITTGGWSLSSFKEGGLDTSKLGFSTVPKMDTSTSIVGPGLSFSIFESSPNKEAAKEFLGAMYSPDIYKQWLKLTGGIPVLKSVTNDPQFADNPVRKVLTDQLNRIKPLHTDYAPSFWAIYDKLLEKTIFTDADIAKEMKAANDILQKEIDTNMNDNGL